MQRLRERMVLGELRALLDETEGVTGWAHVQATEPRRHGVLALTTRRCCLQWSGYGLDDVLVTWDEIGSWHVASSGGGEPVLSFRTVAHQVEMRLPVTSRARARRASHVLARFAELASPLDGPATRTDLEVRAPRRGVYGHTRRVGVTLVGLVTIVVGLAFASPLVPGPGMLTILAGLTLLASEYDWARDLHLWLRRHVDRVLERLRARRRARSGARRA
jgi:uncharacterized protein (TIGR02611 family)